MDMFRCIEKLVGQKYQTLIGNQCFGFFNFFLQNYLVIQFFNQQLFCAEGLSINLSSILWLDAKLGSPESLELPINYYLPLFQSLILSVEGQSTFRFLQSLWKSDILKLHKLSLILDVLSVSQSCILVRVQWISSRLFDQFSIAHFRPTEDGRDGSAAVPLLLVIVS